MEDRKLKNNECEICSKVFQGKGSLYDHTFQVHSEARMFCGLCKVFFKNEPDLSIHNLVSHDTTFLICGRKRCKLQFKTKEELKTHIKNKMKRVYGHGRSTSRFNEHKVGKLYVCGMCEDWSANSVDGLMKHEQGRQTHSQLTLPSDQPHIYLDGKSIICNMCERKFESVNTLMEHIWDKHRETLRNTEGAKPLKCTLCLRRFMNEDGRKSHMLKEHIKKSLSSKKRNKKNDENIEHSQPKMDITVEIKLEPADKCDEYFEEIVNIKSEDNGVDFKVEGTLMPSQGLTINRNDDLIIQGKQYPCKTPYPMFLAQNPIKVQSPTLPPSRYTSGFSQYPFGPHHCQRGPPSQYEYGPTFRFQSMPQYPLMPHTPHYSTMPQFPVTSPPPQYPSSMTRFPVMNPHPQSRIMFPSQYPVSAQQLEYEYQNQSYGKMVQRRRWREVMGWPY